MPSTNLTYSELPIDAATLRSVIASQVATTSRLNAELTRMLDENNNAQDLDPWLAFVAGCGFASVLFGAVLVLTRLLP
jgi:hypothetical protein